MLSCLMCRFVSWLCGCVFIFLLYFVVVFVARRSKRKEKATTSERNKQKKKLAELTAGCREKRKRI